MNKQTVPVLAKTAPSGGSSVASGECYNATTLAAMQEADDIMSGKKKVKWQRFRPEATLAEVKEELKKMFGF